MGIIEVRGHRSPALAIGTAALDIAAVARTDPAPAAASIASAITLEALLRQGPTAMAWLDRLASHADSHPQQTIHHPTWRAPLSEPQKICAIGLNYLDHCKEQGVEPPAQPRVFAKFASAIVGPGDEVVWDPQLTASVDWEAELGVVIGKKARHVSRAKALEHVAGYVNANDVSARDLQRADQQFVRSKSLDTFCPLGPFLATRDEIKDPQRLRVQSRVNGKTKQDSNTAHMIFPVDHLISYLSDSFTLLPGDLILTGTPAGVGAARQPPEFLRDDDRVEVEIEGLGVLENRCRTRR